MEEIPLSKATLEKIALENAANPVAAEAKRERRKVFLQS
jgi:hypothetical protein